ncbi:MAG: glutamyl-tRNA reductase [Elusimicrobia bacterium]|nr:glutamyl-tRNA reductase [Elusimicrobiota bacterium]MDE2237615.1 glutamyl-tRNA reductase [Elusimicrobiota bacterium]MDE2424974.1 glutamyl-tRNA reductase [Elusimicrobiota bacterium]
MGRFCVVGLSHKRQGSESARGRLAAVAAPDVYERLRERGICEAVVLSTCNRFEIYWCDDASGEQDWERGFLEELAGVPIGERHDLRCDAAAVGHLLEVACGLDSLVVGESEILGQVKGAYEAAQAAGMTGKRLNVLFQRALYAGKRARRETGISAGQISVASVAAQLAETIFGSLSGSHALILGAGATAELAARHLLGRKVGRLSIANRTLERGRELASRLGAALVDWEQISAALEGVDIVVASTSAGEPVLRHAQVEEAMRRRSGRSLFIIDIAMPPNVEETAHRIEHVYLYRLLDLQGIADANLRARQKAVEQAQALIREKTEELWRWLAALEAGQELSLKHSPARP